MKELYITNKMRGKMTGMSSLNTSPYQNSYCISKRKNPNNICNTCYSFRALDTYLKGADNRWIDNGVMLSEDYLKDSEVPIINSLYFRFNAHGELINDMHYHNIGKIAHANPRTIFALWSKRVNIVRNGYRPSNLILVYSNPKLNPGENKRHMPYPFRYSFNVYTKEFAEENDIDINCQSRCLECLRCYQPDKYTWEEKIINEIRRK